jgi:hypothetical protein
MIGKFGELNQYRSSLGKGELALIIRETPAGRFLRFALEIGSIENIRSIMDHFFAGEMIFIRDARIKEDMKKAKALVS